MSVLHYSLVAMVVGLTYLDVKAASIGRLDTIANGATAPWGGFVVSARSRLFVPSNNVREHTIRSLDDPFRARYHVSLRDSCGEELSSEIKGFPRAGLAVLEAWQKTNDVQREIFVDITKIVVGVDYTSNTVLWWRNDVTLISVLDQKDAILAIEHGTPRQRYVLLDPVSGTRMLALDIPGSVFGMPNVVDNGRKLLWLSTENTTVYDIASNSCKQYREVIPRDILLRMHGVKLGYGEHGGEPCILVLNRFKGWWTLKKYFLGESAPCDSIEYSMGQTSSVIASLINGTDTLFEGKIVDGRFHLKLLSLEHPTPRLLWKHIHSVGGDRLEDCQVNRNAPTILGNELLIRFFYGSYLIDVTSGKESFIGGFCDMNNGVVCADGETIVMSSTRHKKSVVFNIRTKGISIRDYDHFAMAPGSNLVAFLRSVDGEKFCMVEDVVARAIIKCVPIPPTFKDSTITVLSFSSSGNKLFLNTGPYTLYVLDVNEASRSFPEIFPCQYIPLASFTEDDRFVYVYGCTAVQVWDCWMEQPVASVEGTSYLNAYSRAILPGERIGLLQKDGEAQYVSLPDLKPINRLRMPHGWYVRQFMDANHVIVSHDERLLITDRHLFVRASIRYPREFEAAISSFYHCNPEANRMLVANQEGNLIMLAYIPPMVLQE